jgi:hypothetical protein
MVRVPLPPLARHFQAIVIVFSNDGGTYAHIDLSIASWWGPESKLDRACLTMLMDKTIAMQSQVKWTVYYEAEQDLRKILIT